MKKKGLKNELKPRHKTMAQPEIMHDFGELGKWSEGTLKANIKIKTNWCGGKVVGTGYFCKQIKKDFKQLYKEYCDVIEKLESKRYFFPTLGTVRNDVLELNETRKRCDQLLSDYFRHIGVVERIVEKMRKQKK